MALSIRQKRVRRISGDPVDGVVVQGPVDGLATGTPLYSVAVQGTIDGRTTCRPRGWRFGTWNVGTLTGRSLEVVEELQRRMVDVAALQEVRWKGEGTRFVGAKGGRYKLWWKGDDGTGGVGVMVREELLEQVLEVRRRSNGVIVVVMVFGKVIVRVISGYAPQQSRKEEEKDRFYDDVSDKIGQAGLNEFVVLLGDLNGHVGADADGYEGVHGGWGYGIRNEEGRRVLELADAHSMVVGNTWFTREPARLITYRSGEHRSMIDYILVRAKHRKYVKNVKAIPEAKGQGKAVKCSQCEYFAHANCVSIPEEVCNLLDSSTNLRWFCDRCSNVFNKLNTLNDLNANIKSELENINATLESNREKLNQLESTDVFRGELNILKNDMKVFFADIVSRGLKGHADDIKAEVKTVQTTINDAKQIKERENNLIMFHLLESDGDRVGVMKTLKHLSNNVVYANLVHLTRLGKKPDDHTRPLLLKMDNVDIKNMIIKNVSKLKSLDVSLGCVGLSHDLFPEQRKELRSRIEEARALEAFDKGFLYYVRGQTNDPYAANLNDIFDNFQLINHVKAPTHLRGGTLDLIVASEDFPAHDCLVHPSFQPPPALNFDQGNVEESWKVWIQRFELFLFASRSDQLPEKMRHNLSYETMPSIWKTMLQMFKTKPFW
ncbi:hypothetical protein HELRODRAFT_182599 [Helobdella robusta]|uniref:Endonuclease/exonuclease/phosphatase domain-containing protein n=2 Tax=Helobdella robusta TaxID=6412 RepID=T1FIG0_HELRO|nr:hypothetical protein HELRODRAFT_182599 [Helobdella robusta]ESN90771.1 hypothetical protein HELRODRAFT_182599 [Helobdella robusta]